MTKNFLIVGGSSGLGKEYARYCLGLERDFFIISSRASDDFPNKSIICDLSDQEAVHRVIKELVNSKTRFDSLVFFQRSRHHAEENQWMDEFTVSVSSTRAFLQRAELLMSETGLKSVVVITSTASEFISDLATDSYHVSKAAQSQLVRFYAHKLGKAGIRINSISPFTFMKPENRKFYSENDVWNKFVNERIPLKKSCEALDVINAIEFLLNDKASMITGQNLIVDGGLSLSFGEKI